MAQELFDYRKRILVTLTEDELQAHVMLNVTEEELLLENRLKLITEIAELLKEKNICFGVKTEVLKGTLVNNEKILIAEGIPSEDGVDSEIKLYNMKEIKPQLDETGAANFYEINLISSVKKGDCLGERIKSTKGTDGKTVTNLLIKANPGKLLPLLYDKKTVKMVEVGEVTKLLASIDGAVYFNNEEIAVSNFLKISQDVDFKMGNVSFDGSITITESVLENFSVSATKDIQISGQLGITGANRIQSHAGSIVIKGGVSGKNKTTLKAKKNIYAKFLADTRVVCDGTLNVGYYCINCDIVARDVIIESRNGKIIGGTVRAKTMVISPQIGNEVEKPTIIKVEGFDMGEIKRNINELVDQIEKLSQKKSYLTKELDFIIQSKKDTETVEEKMHNIDILVDEISELDYQYKNYLEYMKSKLGEGGEVRVSNSIYPGVTIEIKDFTKNIKQLTRSKNYYVEESQIVESS